MNNQNFQLTHPPPFKKDCLINRRQQLPVISIQPLELPPLSQLLPATSPLDLIQPYNENTISQYIKDTVDMTDTDTCQQYLIPNDNEEQDRQRQFSNSSQSSTERQYSFISIPGVNQKKRPRRKYDEIERLYRCNWPDCTKAYGTLNHLNAHISMQKHGPKRQPSEFREMRKEWRKQKKERSLQRTQQKDHYSPTTFHLHK